LNNIANTVDTRINGRGEIEVLGDSNNEKFCGLGNFFKIRRGHKVSDDDPPNNGRKPRSKEKRMKEKKEVITMANPNKEEKEKKEKKNPATPAADATLGTGKQAAKDVTGKKATAAAKKKSAEMEKGGDDWAAYQRGIAAERSRQEKEVHDQVREEGRKEGLTEGRAEQREKPRQAPTSASAPAQAAQQPPPPPRQPSQQQGRGDSNGIWKGVLIALAILAGLAILGWLMSGLNRPDVVVDVDQTVQTVQSVQTANQAIRQPQTTTTVPVTPALPQGKSCWEDAWKIGKALHERFPGAEKIHLEQLKYRLPLDYTATCWDGSSMSFRVWTGPDGFLHVWTQDLRSVKSIWIN